MLFFTILALVMFVPGYLLSLLIGAREYRFLVSITLSYFSFIILIALSGQLSLTLAGSAIVMLVYIALLLAGVIVVSRFRPARMLEPTALFSETLHPWTVPGIILATGLYHLFAGYYDEIPSDLFQHLNYTGREWPYIEEGFPLDFRDVLGLHSSSDYWYFVILAVATLCDYTRLEFYPYVLVFSAMVFMIGAALFADRLFRAFRFSRNEHQAAVVLSVFFVFTQMGVDVISYVRYYSYAPSMLNFVVYFTGLVYALNLFEQKGCALRSMSLIVIATFTAYLVHEQEALFIIITCGLLALWRCAETVWDKRHLGLRAYLWPLLLLLALVAGALAIYVYVRLDRGFRPPRINKVIPLPFTIPLFGRPYVLDPGYQFMQVVTIWGLAVYVLFLFQVRQFVRQPLLVLGMLSPLVTVFNPLFVDLFLRMGHDTTLWRLCYLIPLQFVAGAGVVFLWGRLRSGAVHVRAIAGAVIVALFLLLLPSIGPVPLNAYAKTTLARVGDANRPSHWMDALEFLSSLDKDYTVLTDPVTGYMLAAFTRHRTYQYKFLPNAKYYRRPFLFDSYADFPLSKYGGKLILVNLRNGAPSRTGELSNHWHREILRVEDYYSDALVEHLESHPDHFEKLWSQDRISVYRVY